MDKLIGLVGIYQEYTNGVVPTYIKSDNSIKNEQKQYESLLDTVKNYVSNTRALTGKDVSFSDQVDYYSNMAKKFKDGSKEQIEVLKLQRDAEDKLNKQIADDERA